MVYGILFIVCEVGGLKDMVNDYDKFLECVIGFGY